MTPMDAFYTEVKLASAATGAWNTASKAARGTMNTIAQGVRKARPAVSRSMPTARHGAEALPEVAAPAVRRISRPVQEIAQAQAKPTITQRMGSAAGRLANKASPGRGTNAQTTLANLHIARGGAAAEAGGKALHQMGRAAQGALAVGGAAAAAGAGGLALRRRRQGNERAQMARGGYGRG